MNRAPFYLIPWQESFIHALLPHALAVSNNNLGNCLFIFPHKRPASYLQDLISHASYIKRPTLLPEVTTVSELTARLRLDIYQTPAFEAHLLDQVGLLLRCAREHAQEESEDKLFFLQDAARFFPWGVRLAGLFEECFTQLCYPDNFLYMEHTVTPYAAYLLEHLGSLFSLYRKHLLNLQWTTPGFTTMQVAEHLDTHGTLPGSSLADKHIFIAGFHALTSAEDALFSYLARTFGATVVLHGDPALAEGESGHWSCTALASWAKRWKAPIECLGASACDFPLPRVHYYQGYDLHSQLQKTQELIATHEKFEQIENAQSSTPPLGQEFSAATALVLPDSGLLMPALHHLPTEEINISMGYPLDRSPLFSLLNTIFLLQETRREKTYYWRHVINLVRHPYLAMLTTPAADTAEPFLPAGPEIPLRNEFYRLEQTLLDTGRAFFNLREVAASLMCADIHLPEDLPSEPIQELFASVLEKSVFAFESPATPAQLGAALQSLCTLLVACGGDLWQRFPIDAECLHRLTHSLIPALTGSSLAHEPFPLSTLLSMTRELISAERVPFEASPLVGLQVMGFLETRLLSFKHLIILDSCEELLPGSSQGDPLLPEALRPLLGLPPLHSREQVIAYHFFRLIHSAHEVSLLWQENAEGADGQKKKKSRFIEELLWEEEQKQGRLFAEQGQDGPLEILSPRLGHSRANQPGVLISPTMHSLICNRLTKSVSASLLDAYLQCPVRFLHEKIYRLQKQDDINEGDAPLEVGNLLHEALKEFFSARLNIPFPGVHSPEDLILELQETLWAQPGYLRLHRQLPADSLAMLESACRIRLRNYLRLQEETIVLLVETPIKATLSIGSAAYTLSGTVDRLDKRGNEFLVLDYKTGTLKVTPERFWSNLPLWDRIRAWENTPSTKDTSLLAAVSKEVNSVQLPFYLQLFNSAPATLQNSLPQNKDEIALCTNAAFIALASQGEEAPLFNKNISYDERIMRISEHIPTLTSFLIRHMTTSEVYTPHPGKHCDYCPVWSLCRQNNIQKNPT